MAIKRAPKMTDPTPGKLGAKMPATKKTAFEKSGKDNDTGMKEGSKKDITADFAQMASVKVPKQFPAKKAASSAKAPLGSGGRFAALKSKIEGQGKSPKVAAAIAASAGRKKYGVAKMSSMAAKGRKK